MQSAQEARARPPSAAPQDGSSVAATAQRDSFHISGMNTPRPRNTNLGLMSPELQKSVVSLHRFPPPDEWQLVTAVTGMNVIFNSRDPVGKLPN